MQISAIASAHRQRLDIPAPLVNWLLCWLVLPNLPFAIMWLVGGQPRVMDIFVIGMVGLLLRREKAWVRFGAFAALVTASVVLYVSTLFKLSLNSILSSLGFILELRPAASPEYLFGGLLLVAVFALAWRSMRARQDFDAPLHIVTAGAMLLGLCALDGWLTADASRHSKPATFSSAATQTGFEALAADGNHLVIVMVEAWGVPRDPTLRARLTERWNRPDIAGRYQLETGSTPFWGSTTYGEMRELCGRWGDYHPLKSAPDPGCLPARLAAQGYQTAAIHGFDEGFFERTAWYPKAGFQQLVFRDQLARSGAATCGGVFPGVCDRDIPARIGERLKRAQTKQFVYWLTLSSHLPVPKSDTLGTDRCERFDARLARDHAMICRLFSLWHQVDKSLAAMLTDPALPPTDVLIVGDHAPPLLDRSQRSQFDGGRVPWVLLKDRRSRARPAT
jgi:uncharacterized membrane protein